MGVGALETHRGAAVQGSRPRQPRLRKQRKATREVRGKGKERSEQLNIKREKRKAKGAAALRRRAVGGGSRHGKGIGARRALKLSFVSCASMGTILGKSRSKGPPACVVVVVL